MSENIVSAIVVSYQTGAVLGACLESLAADEAVAEIILVDNGNPDGAVESAADGLDKSIRIVTGQGNIGFAAGCNRGAALATGDILLFLNPDAALPAEGAARMVADGAQLSRPWMMGPMLVGADGEEQRGARRAALTPMTALWEATGLARLAPGLFRPFNLHRTPAPHDLTQYPTLSGACFLMPKTDYYAIGGMDEGYFLHVEDIDFCRRFRNAGGAVWFNPHVRVVHQQGSSESAAREVEAHKTRGLIRYFDTHFETSWPAPLRWALARGLWVAYAARTFIRR